MRHLFYVVVLFSISFFDVEAQNNVIKIKGSDTMQPLVIKATDAFIEKHPDLLFSIECLGTKLGIEQLLEGNCDLATCSRPLSVEEKDAFRKKGITLKTIIVGYDALVVIANKAAGITRITREQLEAIFTGKIKNWKEFGGANLHIVPYSRNANSGTYTFFKEYILNKSPYGEGVLELQNTQAIADVVKRVPGAISYAGQAYVKDTALSVMAISFDGGKEFTAPMDEMIRGGLYPISRPLFFYYNSKNTERLKTLIDFILSHKGQDKVKESGYIPVY